MQKTTKKTTDFFSLYRSSQLRKTFLSGGIAVFAAFSIVTFTHGDVDMQGLMASVANVSNTQQYDADLIMTRQDNTLSIIFGAKATTVDQVVFTLLSDPTKFKSLITSDTAVHIVSEKETGSYRVTIDMQGRDIAPGTRIATLVADIDSDLPIALTDTKFVSGGQRYSISSKGE